MPVNPMQSRQKSMRLAETSPLENFMDDCIETGLRRLLTMLNACLIDFISMGPQWEIVKEWTTTASGIGTIVLVILALVVLSGGSPTYSVGLSMCSTALAVYSFLGQRLRQSSLVAEKVEAFKAILNRVSSSGYVPALYQNQSRNSEFVGSWTNRWIKTARRKFGRDASLFPRGLIGEVVTDWLNCILGSYMKNPPLRDFLVYSFLLDNFPESKDALGIIKEKYADFVISVGDGTRRPFFGLVFSYFIEQKRTLGDLEKACGITDETHLEKAYYFVQGGSQLTNQIMDRFEQLFTAKEQAQFLMKLTNELRSYFKDKGISIDKFGEAYLSASENVFAVFRAEERANGKQKPVLKDSIERSGYPVSGLYFTGPQLIFAPKEISDTAKLKQKLFPTIDPKHPHVLLVARLATPDVLMSSGPLTQPWMKRVANELVLVGKASARMGNYLTRIEKLPQEFIESLHMDFLILSLRDRDVDKIRDNEDDIIDKISQKTSYTISKLTDFSKLKDADVPIVQGVFEKLGLSSTDSKEYAAELIRGARNWSYILYGTGGPQIPSPLPVVP